MATAHPNASLEQEALAPTWQRVLALGTALWIASVLVTALTANVNLIPTVVLLGSFLVPVTAVIWYLDHYHSQTLTPRLIFYAFLVGGVLGVLGASLLEAWLLSDGLLVYLGVGLIEEFCKLAALLLIAWNLPRYTTRDGVVLGAAVGFGFGALESAGYAFNALIVHTGPVVGLSLSNLVNTELLRGILTPVGHGLWTAILGGVVFRASRDARHPRITLGVILAYLGVSLLHALWDSMRGIALLVATLITATPIKQIALTSGLLPPPSAVQMDAYLGVEWGGLAVVSLLGYLWLRNIWRVAPAVPSL
jgi:RsiW-degrading membrane proteinase PrsW (M82 family)